MPYQRLLVPLDDSAIAQRGLAEALALARELRSTLVLLHVVELVPVMSEVATAATWKAIDEGLKATGHRLLDAAAKKVRAAGERSCPGVNQRAYGGDGVLCRVEATP